MGSSDGHPSSGRVYAVRGIAALATNPPRPLFLLSGCCGPLQVRLAPRTDAAFMICPLCGGGTTAMEAAAVTPWGREPKRDGLLVWHQQTRRERQKRHRGRQVARHTGTASCRVEASPSGAQTPGFPRASACGAPRATARGARPAPTRSCRRRPQHLPWPRTSQLKKKLERLGTPAGPSPPAIVGGGTRGSATRRDLRCPQLIRCYTFVHMCGAG